MSEIKVSGISGVNSAMNPLMSDSRTLLALRNMVSDVNGWAIKRHGIKQLNATSSFSSVFSTISSASASVVCAWYFDDHIFVYVEDGTNSGIAAYSIVQSGGWHKVVESSSIIRLDSPQYKMRPCIADRRLLLTTGSGVKRVAAIYNDFFPKDSASAVNYSTMYRNAGIPRGLDPRCPSAVALGATYGGKIALAGYEWLSASSAVAYRIAWFKRDENGVPGIGMPSGRVVVRNTNAGVAYATRLKVNIPAGCSDSSYVMQIYRTNVITIDGASVIPDPGDEMFLAGEYRMTATDLSNKYVLYEDVSFDGILGNALYTNETQEGALAGRMQPPLCRDISYFGGCAFFSNTTERQRLTMKILAVDPTAAAKGLRVGDKITAGDVVMEAVSVATAEDTQPWYFEIDATAGVGSEVIRAIKTAESFVYKFNIMSNTYNGRYYAYNLTTNNDIVGIVGFEEKSIGGSTGAYIGINRVDAPVQILPIPTFTSTPNNTLALACAVVTDVGPTTVTVTTSAAHNLTTNDLVFLAPFAASTESGTSSPRLVNTDVPAGVYKVTVTGATTYTFPSPSGAASNQTDARAATTGGWSHKIFDAATSIWTEARSDNNRRINRLMWSSPFEPETAPIINTTDIGAAEKAIIRIVPTQDSLFVFKEDGIWRLKGNSGDWEIIVLDAGIVIAAPETPGVVDGRVFFYSTNGVMAVDDGGVNKISTPIGGLVDNYYRAVASTAALAAEFSGVGHGEDQSYWINFGDQAVTWRYNIPTRTWSEHYWSDTRLNNTLSFIFVAKASRYSTFDVQAYSERLVVCFSSTGAGASTIGIERKTGNTSELCDLDIPAVVTSFDANASTVTLSAVPAATEVGDTFLWYAVATYSPGGYGTGSQVQHRGIISAINSLVLTLTNTDTMSSWPAVSGAQAGSIMKQIPSRIVFTPMCVAGGFTAAHFSELDFSAGSQGSFSKVTVGFSSETSYSSDAITTDQYTSSVNGYLAAPTTSNIRNRSPGRMSEIRSFRTGVPREVAMSATLIVSLSHFRAFEQFDLAGVRLIFEAGNNKTRRTNA